MTDEIMREERYIVFKLEDLHRYCSNFNISSIERVWQIIAEGRALEGKRPFSAVVIENDLPGYEPIWKAIEARVTGAQPAQKAVAYLDLGVGGYMDIGTDLNDEQLAALPKGRHMLGIVGTYGVNGYVSAQPAPLKAIAKILAEVMDIAAANGADSRSMPDEYVEVAAWLCGVSPQPAPSIPEDWKLVPTAESRHPGIYKMLGALHAVDNTPGASEWESYAAMLEAAPGAKGE